MDPAASLYTSFPASNNSNWRWWRHPHDLLRSNYNLGTYYNGWTIHIDSLRFNNIWALIAGTPENCSYDTCIKTNNQVYILILVKLSRIK
jgi:hypothetical protein